MMQMAMRNEIYSTCFWKCVKKGLLIFEVPFTEYANRSESELSIFSIGCFLTKHQTGTKNLLLLSNVLFKSF